jgi:dihydroorotate dehydrogenase
VLIGVGGVFTAADAYEKIRSGASLVQLITGMIFMGPQQIGLINKELAELLRRDGYRSVSEAVGSVAR